jgi:hypothetical protein
VLCDSVTRTPFSSFSSEADVARSPAGSALIRLTGALLASRHVVETLAVLRVRTHRGREPVVRRRGGVPASLHPGEQGRGGDEEKRYQDHGAGRVLVTQSGLPRART